MRAVMCFMLALALRAQLLGQQSLDSLSLLQIDEEQAKLIVSEQYAQMHQLSEEAVAEEEATQMTIQQLADVVAENTYVTQKYSAIVLEDQLGKLELQLADVEAQIQDIQDNLPPVDEDDVCSAITKCSKCVRDQQCGWCIQENRCVRGDNIGPKNTLCNFYNYYYCSGPACIKYLDCSSCLSDPNCGWCEDQVHMQITCLEQPSSFTGCPAVGWFHPEGQLSSCPKKELPPVQDIYEEDTGKKKKKKKGKGDEPIDRFRPKTWEQNVQDERAKILQDRQAALEGATQSEKSMYLDKARQDLDTLEQQRITLQTKIASIQKQLS